MCDADSGEDGFVRNRAAKLGEREKSVAALNRNLMNDPDRIQRKDSSLQTKRLRCPYCVEGNEFKVMEPREKENGWYMCENCGHLAMPQRSDFRCRCVKCSGLGASTRLDQVARTLRRKSLQE